MNKFRLEDVKISHKADMKIKKKLYILMLQKKLTKMKELFTSISFGIKILVPVCVLLFAIFGFNTFWSTNTDLQDKSSLTQQQKSGVQSKKANIAKQIVADHTTKKYVKKSRERMKKMRYERYKNLSQLRSVRARGDAKSS